MCTNQGCKALVFLKDDSTRFFYYQLLAARSEIKAWGQGSTFQELGRNKLNSIMVVQPPFYEQEVVAAFLDRETAKIDGLIA
jgi:type I restriction enzyme S subunit